MECGPSIRSPQALFFLGMAWLAGNRGGVSWLSRRWLFWLAVGLSLAGFLIRFSWTLHGFYDPIPVLLKVVSRCGRS